MGNEQDRRIPLNSPQSGDHLAFLDLQKSIAGADPSILLEIKGQLAFVNSDALPTDMDELTRKALIKAGVEFGEMVPGDDMFGFATLPKDWVKVKTGERIKSHLLDQKRRLRGVILYRESFASELRMANLTAMPRFSFEIDQETLRRTGLVIALIIDAGEPIAKTLPLPANSSNSIERASDQARKWLREHYPHWQNPGAYWDDDQDNLVSAS